MYASPGDLSETGVTWRQVLQNYNEQPGNNPFGLLPAHQLCTNRTYERLTKRFGLENVFIFSASWGLISADFLTPQYDITFGASAEAYKRRGKRDRYEDFRMLPESADQVVFLGGKDYLPLFCGLTSSVRGRKTVFYNSRNSPTRRDATFNGSKQPCAPTGTTPVRKPSSRGSLSRRISKCVIRCDQNAGKLFKTW